MTDTVTLALDEIESDFDAVCPRHRLDTSRIAEFGRLYRDGCNKPGEWNASALPPLHVVATPAGMLLADGWHREAALRHIGAKTAQCVIVSTVADTADAFDAAYIHAVETSAISSQPLTASERREAIIAFRRMGLTIEDSARKVGVSLNTARKALKSASPVGVPEPREPKAPDIDALMRRLINDAGRAWKGKGMTEGWLTSDRGADRLTVALIDKYGPKEAHTWARRLRGWSEGAERRIAREQKRAS